MEVCPPEQLRAPGCGPRQAYSATPGDRPAAPRPLCRPHPAGLAIDSDALVLGQGDAADGGGGGVSQARLGAQERAVGAPGRALGAAGGRLDASRRPLDARERHLGAEAAVLAAPGGRALDARPGDLAPDGGDRRVAARPRQWRSESDLAGSEEAALPSPPPADSDSDSDSGRQQAWRSETHLASAAAAGRGTLSQRYRSQPCLVAARPDYSGVSSRVAAYIQRRRQQDRAARARRRLSHSPDPPAGDAADPEPEDGAGSGGDCRTLAARLAVERAERRERERQLEQLQTDYQQLVTKYAEAETYIDRMRFCRPPGAERPGSESLRPALHATEDWDARDATGKMMISPNETHTSQSSRFSRLSGVKSAILRRHSDEESSFRRFVQSKKELFPDGVGSRDSSFSDRGSVDLSDGVIDHIEEGHPHGSRCSPVFPAGGVDSTGGSSASPDDVPVAHCGWGPTSAPPALGRTRHHRSGAGAAPEAEPPSGERWGEDSEEPSLTGETRTPGPAGARGSLLSSQAVKSITSVGKKRSDLGDVSSEERCRSVGSSLEERQHSRVMSMVHRERSRDVSSERRRESRGSVSLSLSESRDPSLGDSEPSVASPADSEPSGSPRDISLEQRPSSRDSGSTEAEGNSQQSQGNQESHCLCNIVTTDSVMGHQPMLRDRSSGTRSRSRDDTSESPPGLSEPSPTETHSSQASETPGWPKSSSLASRCRSRFSEGSSVTSSGDRLITPQTQLNSLARGRRRSSSDPGYGRREAPPPVAETPQRAEQQPPASRDRLQGVLSVLASQVQVIQAMVGQRGRSSRAARRCRSLSRRVARSRVSVSPGDVVDRVEVDGVPVGRRGHRPGSGVGGRRDRSVSPSPQPRDRDGPEGPPSGPGPVRRRHAAGVGPDPIRDDTPPGRPVTNHSGSGRVSDIRPAAGREDRASGGQPTPPGGTSGRDGAVGREDRASGGQPTPPGGTSGRGSADHQRSAVPPLPLSELESEQGDYPGSCCSLSPRTVSPTRKVEQWQAGLAEVSPEPPPSPCVPGETPLCPSGPEGQLCLSRPGPELRRLAGAVRGLQRQMSGFCRLVDHLRSSPVTPVTPVTPGSPGSSEASGARRRRYLRERRGLHLPLLPDKPAPPGPGPAPGQGQRRWDICRPPTRRAASCERAVQTETELQPPLNGAHTRPAVSRSDGELTSTAATPKRFHDTTTCTSAQWDRATLLAREVNLRSRCILEGVIRSTAC